VLNPTDADAAERLLSQVRYQARSFPASDASLYFGRTASLQGIRYYIGKLNRLERTLEMAVWYFAYGSTRLRAISRTLPSAIRVPGGAARSRARLHAALNCAELRRADVVQKESERRLGRDLSAETATSRRWMLSRIPARPRGIAKRVYSSRQYRVAAENDAKQTMRVTIYNRRKDVRAAPPSEAYMRQIIDGPSFGNCR